MSRLSETLREAIEEEVATGKLAPGTHLDEIELARRFGVSRTPIREALSLLAGEGMVEIRPRRGAVVAQITPQRLVEMSRHAIEVIVREPERAYARVRRSERPERVALRAAERPRQESHLLVDLLLHIELGEERSKLGVSQHFVVEQSGRGHDRCLAPHALVQRIEHRALAPRNP